MKNVIFPFLLCCFQVLGAAQLVVMRHGEGEHNLQHVLSSLTKEEGGVDHCLTEKGKCQVIETARTLLEAGFTKETVGLVLVSPLLRTRQTAQILADCGVCSESSMQIEERIREQVQKDWEGKFIGDISSATQNARDWMEEASISAQHGGESLESIQLRLTSLLDELSEWDSSKGHVILVMHGYTGLVFLDLHGEALDKKLKTAEAKIISLPSIRK